MGLLVNINTQLSVTTPESQIAVMKVTFTPDMAAHFLMKDSSPLDKVGSEVIICAQCVCINVQNVLGCSWMAPTMIPQKYVYGASPPLSIIHC